MKHNIHYPIHRRLAVLLLDLYLVETVRFSTVNLTSSPLPGLQQFWQAADGSILAIHI